jgi:1-acyl-sn-glycerol-3-phosphate acyltransferase
VFVVLAAIRGPHNLLRAHPEDGFRLREGDPQAKPRSNPFIYGLVATLLRPVAWWGRLRVQGLEVVPQRRPLLVVPNHDSQWDPVLAGLAVRPRRRLRFLARASLWRIPGVGPLLHGLGQIPIRAW